MSAWPTLREWMQFGGTLALELVIVFAVAKLVALRVRSAQGRRALWQITLLAMLLVSVGELNGVRGWLQLPEKKISPPTAATQKVIVTLKDVEPGLDLFRDFELAAVPPPPAPRPSRWQERAVWPALIWMVGLALILFRMLVAQMMALALRVSQPAERGSPEPQRVTDTALSDKTQRLATALGLRRKVMLLTSERTIAPFTFGVWRPVIVLPQKFSSAFTPEQQDAALAHELAHVANFDSAWRTLSQFACAVLWWHPLVWLTKRELDHASELVADEASLLVANGPDRLAECLLACAKELRRPALAGWLGMDGGGFRSALGKRVTRLLQLNPHARLSRPVPWYLRLLAPVVCAALLWLGMAAVMKSSAPRGGAWRNSIVGSAFAAAANKTPAPAAPPRNIEAESSARTNTAAARPNFTSVKRQAIYEKLRSIRLSEWGPLDNLPLSEVIRGLSEAVRRNDPDHQGVNFILNQNATSKPGNMNASGQPIAPTNEPAHLNGTTIRLGTKLSNLNAEEVLNIVEKIADTKIKYSVEDFGVVISPKDDEPPPLHTRFFHLDSNDFQRVLQSMPPELTNASSKTLYGRGGQSSGTNATNGVRFHTDATSSSAVIPGVQNWFKSLGVDLADPGKAVFYNDRLGMLMIRATLEDLDVIEKALQPFGIKPGAEFLEGRAAAGEPANTTEDMQIEAAKLVQDGKIYYETGQMHAARTNLQAALRLQPTNQGALYYLDLVNARELAVRAKLKELKVPMDTPTNQVQEASSTNLQTRFFKVDPKTLEQGLKSISTHDQRSGRKPVFNPYDTNSVIERVQRLFQTAGVDLSAPGRALFYQEGVGTVMVRATPAEMETVEKAIQLLNLAPPQLTIRVKVFEVAKTNAAQSLDWFLGTVLTNPPPRNRADPNAAVPTITGVLTDWQFREVVRALEQRGGTDLMSAPEITTMSGRQAQIKVVDIQYIVTEMSYSAFTTNTTSVKKPSGSTGVTTGGADDGLDSVITPIAQPFEIGPVIDVVPYVEADGYTITMTVLPTMREFLGYDDPGDFSITVSNRVSQKTLTQPVPLPKFRLRQIATTARVWDGQTLMLSAGSARTFQRKPGANGVITTNYTGKELIFFITPRLIDPAGNPLHADDEFPERHKTVPGQRNGKP